MVVLGSNSDVAKAFVEKMLKEGEKFEVVHLCSSNPEQTERFAKHIEVKYEQKCKVIELDVMQGFSPSIFDNVEAQTLFCATGYLGKNSEEGLYDTVNTERIIDINYAKLIPVLQFFAEKFEKQKLGTMIVLSSVAGERGRQSNFMYGSAKAGLTAYLEGLRNYMYPRNVKVLTVIPGFMDTKMTADIETPKPLTASPEQAAKIIYKAYKRNKNIVYVGPIWRLIMLIIRNIPEFIFKRLKM